MYTSPLFNEDDTLRLHEFIETHCFATVVTPRGSEPVVSHLTLLLDRSIGKQGQLIGHLAKANPQWKSAKGKSR
jgi:hypothetical protein